MAMLRRESSEVLRDASAALERLAEMVGKVRRQARRRRLGALRQRMASGRARWQRLGHAHAGAPARGRAAVHTIIERCSHCGRDHVGHVTRG